MISVITPTMWQFEPFCKFLRNMVQLSVIGEVIIINNLVEKTPNDPILFHPKIRILNQEKNIFVNPAWNLGAEEAKFENLCFLSDDVIVDLKVFLETDEFISTNPNSGLIFINPTIDLFRLHAGDEYSSSVKDSSLNIENVKLTGLIEFTEHFESVYGSGSLFFVQKKNWNPIPEELKVFFGDNWIFETQKLSGRINYAIQNCFFYSPWSVTVKSDLVRDQPNDESEIFSIRLNEWMNNYD